MLYSIRSITPVIVAVVFAGIFTGCTTMQDTSKMEEDIATAGAPQFGTFMTHLVKADHHLEAARGIQENMTGEPNTYGNKPRFNKAGEEHAALSIEHREKAEVALMAIFGHLIDMHVPASVGKTTVEVFFNLGSSSLSSAESAKLKEIVEIAKMYPGSSIGVVGYADTIASESFNKALAQRRVNTVVSSLKSMGATSHALVTTLAYGQIGDPDETDIPENRKVVVRIQPHDRPLNYPEE